MPRLAPVLLLALVGAPAAALAPNPVDVDATCVQHELRYSLVAGEPVDHTLVGWLCAIAPYDGQTVIVASPTGLSDRSYWDWRQDADTYSFVRHATQQGYAVFNYDRIGTGLSDRPDAALVTIETEAYVLHQIVTDLRAGNVGGAAFGKVVLLGNSLSTLISIFEAEAYRDVDGLINTGVFVGPLPQGLITLFSAFYPAQLDPKFAAKDIPLGYATTLPGARAAFFHLPASDPATIALDETLKETATLGEAATFAHWTPFTHLVEAPVLSVMGDHDVLFCATDCQPDGLEVTRERLFWGPQTCAEIRIVEEAGHFLQLHPQGAADFQVIAFDWLARRVGKGPAEPPTGACAP